jgi:CDP-paratose 2-epimerase
LRRDCRELDPSIGEEGRFVKVLITGICGFVGNFGFPVWIDRCGVLAGAWQFGTPNQGVVSLRYIGFDGSGKQVRDLLHARDLCALPDAQVSAKCSGGHPLLREPDPKPQPYDIPWVIIGSSDAERAFGWSVEVSIAYPTEEIARHAGGNPDWLERSGL